jgi:hypothetical protein
MMYFCTVFIRPLAISDAENPQILSDLASGNDLVLPHEASTG